MRDVTNKKSNGRKQMMQLKQLAHSIQQQPTLLERGEIYDSLYSFLYGINPIVEC